MSTSDPGERPVALAVDPDPAVRARWRHLLELQGCRAVVVERGDEALKLARLNVPELVFIGASLPDMEGASLCARLRGDPALLGTPVIMLTGAATEDAVDAVFRAGAFDHIRLPCTDRELAARIRNALDLKARTDQLRGGGERMARELTLAAEVQGVLLAPRPYFSRRVRARVAYRPSLDVGGDFFDMIPLPDGLTCFYVGDVAGHGVAPAMVAAMLRHLLTQLVPLYAEEGPARVANELHARFRTSIGNPSIYATLFIGLLDEKTGVWRCINCGHPPPLAISDRPEAWLPEDRRGGVPIGLAQTSTAPYSSSDEFVTETPTGRVLLASDGLFEARHAATGAEVSRDTLTEILRDAEPADAQGVVAGLVARGYVAMADDCTVMNVKLVDPASVALQALVTTNRELADAACDIERILANSGWSELAAGGAQLVVMEHGANALEHGELPPGSGIALQMRLSGDVCEILMEDPGMGWDVPSTMANTNGDHDHTRGRGLSIIRAIAGVPETVRCQGVNRTLFTLRRTWTPQT